MMIVLLVCDQFPGILPPDIPSYEWMFEQVFTEAYARYGFRKARQNRPLRFKVYQVWQYSLPAYNDRDIYLITGSNRSAYDNVEWVNLLKRWIRDATDFGCKLAGICFGHQIIAEALGGKVERSPKGWGIGIRRSQIVDGLFRSIAGRDSFTVLYDHHDQVVRMPGFATTVSTSGFCPIESMRIDRQVLTLQGHPEFSNAFIRHWINDCAPDEPMEVKEKALASMDIMENQGVEVAGWIMRFYNL